MKFFSFFITIIFLNISLAVSATIKPNPNLAPRQVVSIQLRALQKNDVPYPNAGIEQTWEFAHPVNKKFTGPFERFSLMIQQGGYKKLLGHKSHKIDLITRSKNEYFFNVSIVTDLKEKLFFEWHVKKVRKEHNLDNCWLTIRVTPPKSQYDSI